MVQKRSSINTSVRFHFLVAKDKQPENESEKNYEGKERKIMKRTREKNHEENERKKRKKIGVLS